MSRPSIVQPWAIYSVFALNVMTLTWNVGSMVHQGWVWWRGVLTVVSAVAVSTGIPMVRRTLAKSHDQ